jgi:Flp pilus assembly protein TadD
MYADHYVLAKAKQEASFRAMAEQCYASAHLALERGDDVNAKRLFGLLAILAPRDERPWIGLAVCSERSDDWPMAGAMYAVGASLANGSAWALFGRGRALKRMGKRAEARRAFDRAEESGSDALLLAAIDEERKTL